MIIEWFLNQPRLAASSLDLEPNPQLQEFMEPYEQLVESHEVVDVPQLGLLLPLFSLPQAWGELSLAFPIACWPNAFPEKELLALPSTEDFL